MQALTLPHPEDTEALAKRLAPLARPGDVLLLSGPIGAGKSLFARAFIRARLGAEVDVPSPTFTLVQTYEDPASDIWHADLYRLGSPLEVIELGLEDAFQSAICLIEWPDRLGDLAPEGALRLMFEAGDTAHHLRLEAPGAWEAAARG